MKKIVDETDLGISQCFIEHMCLREKLQWYPIVCTGELMGQMSSSLLVSCTKTDDWCSEWCIKFSH